MVWYGMVCVWIGMGEILEWGEQGSKGKRERERALYSSDQDLQKSDISIRATLNQKAWSLGPRSQTNKDR